MGKAKGSSPGRVAASGPKTDRRRATTCKRQGELSELAFVHKAASLGFGVARPYGDNERYDFIVDSGQRLWRVQVKSTTYSEEGCYRLRAIRHLCGREVPYRPSEVDFLVAHVIPEEGWFVLPIRAIGNRTLLTLSPSASVPSRPRLWDAYREAWHLLRETE